MTRIHKYRERGIQNLTAKPSSNFKGTEERAAHRDSSILSWSRELDGVYNCQMELRRDGRFLKTPQEMRHKCNITVRLASTLKGRRRDGVQSKRVIER